MGHVMRKPVLATCKQQRHRSACASAQSDQRICFRCLDSIIPLVSISEISSIYLVSVAAQAGLSLPWSQTPKTGFSRDEAHRDLCARFTTLRRLSISLGEAK